MVNRLAQEYKIHVIIHNHPQKNNRFWHPDKVLSHIAPLSPYMGINPDLGHWIRMGIDPAKQIARPELYSKLKAFHFNDCEASAIARSPHCVTGQGAGNLDQVMKTLKTQGFKGRFTIEYRKWPHNYEDIKQIIQYIDEQAK